MNRRVLRAGALGTLLAIGLHPIGHVSAQTESSNLGRIDVHAIPCSGDPATPVIRARNLRHDALAKKFPEYVRTGDGSLRLPPGYYEVWAQTDRCFAQAFVAVVAGERRHVTPTLGSDVRLDRSMGFAGSIAALGATLELADYDRPSLTYALETERNYFYANLAPKRYVLSVTQTSGTTSRFGIDLTDGIAGDLATIDIGVDALESHKNFAGPLFAGADDLTISGGRAWYVDSGRSVVGSLSRNGDGQTTSVDALHDRSEIRSDGFGGVWAFDERANDVVHVDAGGIARTTHMPPHDAQASAGAVVAKDGGLVVVREQLQTVYHVAIDGTLSSVQLRPGFIAKNFGVDTNGTIYFTETDANAPLSRYKDGVLDNVDVTRSSQPETGLDIINDAFEQGRFDGAADAIFRFGLRGTHESAAVSGAVHDGSGGFWTTDCNGRTVAHIKSDRSRLSFPIPAGICPTDLSAGTGGLWLIDRAHPGIVHISTSGVQKTFMLPTKTANVREDSMRVAPDGTLWFIERNPNRIAYVYGSRVVDLPPFSVGGAPQATVLR